jgi:hypothetical protein
MSDASAPTYGSGKTSVRAPMSCAILMKVGPSAANVRAIHSARL